MNKTELVTKISEKTGLTQKDCDAVIKSMTEVVTEALVNGDSVALTGFCTFAVKDREERKIRNPRTGETSIAPKTRVVKAKIGKSLKDAVAK